MSDEEWNFKTKDDSAYIENISERKVLGITEDGQVILDVLEENKADQLWKKGQPNAKDFFTLENCKVPRVLTASSSSSLEIIGNTNLRCMYSQIIK